MKPDTRKIIVAKLRKATDECTDILHDEGMKLKESLQIMTKSYLEMAALNALAASKLLGEMPSKADFIKVSGEVYADLKRKVLQ